MSTSVCIPVNEDRGLESTVCGHFGSAPYFLIVDVDSGGCRAIVNGNRHHEHGHCSPLASLAGVELDAVVVGGIGRGALRAFASVGLPVLAAAHATVRETLADYSAGALRAMSAGAACGGHGHDHDHDHDHHR